MADLTTFSQNSVLCSAEFARIDNLPRRRWDQDQAEELARQLTQQLKTPNGTMTLFPVQAVCLFEAWKYGGLFASLSVSAGKALVDSEPVLTTEGFRAISTLTVGTEVIGSDGTPTTVTGVFPQGTRPIYRVTFSDGNSVQCDESHLWTFYRSGQYSGRCQKPITQTTLEWAKTRLTRKCGSRRASQYFLPMVEPIQLPDKDLPIDPYTLGALLGDGGLTQRVASFTTMDPDILSFLTLPDGVVARPVKHQHCGKATQYNLVKSSSKKGPAHPNPLQLILRGMGLAGVSSKTKFVPVEYLLGSREQRLALLQGLLDTDGYHARTTSIEYCSMSKRLADAVVQLVEMFGGTASINIGQTGAYRVWLKLPHSIIPFRCARKRLPYEQGLGRVLRPPARSVVSIVRAGSASCTCISVDASDGLFAARHCILTHNTLLSLLLARVMQAHRPILMVPAKLVEKTKRDICELANHWVFGVIPDVMSYETLGPKGAKGLLEQLAPDLLILDEGHRVRNPQASRTRKVRHYLQDHPDTRVCVMSGTTIKRALSDYAHLIHWALRGGAPVPHRHDTLEEWDNCLGEKLSLGINRLAPGALLSWCTRGEVEELGLLNAARRGFQRRLAETPGVVCYHVAAEDIGADITLTGIQIQHSPAVLDAFETLREKWELPDGQELVEGCEVYRHARTLALGFYLKWRFPAPKEWLEKRRNYGAFTRAKLKTGRWDSPDEVACAFPVDREVVEWRAIRKSYEPETTIVWVGGEALQLCRDWLKGGGVVWVETVAFGEALAQVAHVPYFGAGGLDSRGQSIEGFAGKACVCSIAANGEGRNLQRFNRFLVTAALPNGPQWEQLIGREHRIGQQADLVEGFMLVGCREHVFPFWQSVRDAELHKYGDGGDPKLLIADIDVMTEAECEALRGDKGNPWGPAKRD